jgi:ATP-binding cassette subfamily F protein 3
MLSKYEGTLLLVSHDRYLLNATTTKTLALSGNGSGTLFEGNYNTWREAQSAPEVVPAKNAVPVPPKPSKSNGSAAPPTSKTVAATPVLNARELSKARVRARERVLSTESAVNATESRIAEVETRLARPSESVAEMVTLAAEHTRLQDDLLAALAAWEQVVAEQEALGL